MWLGQFILGGKFDPPSYFKNNQSDINITLYNCQTTYLEQIKSLKMLTSSVICGVIGFFVTRKCQKIRKIDENSLRRKPSYLLNNVSRSSHRKCSVKWCSQKILRPTTLIRKILWHRCFPVNFCEISKNTFFIEHRTTASVNGNLRCWFQRL